MQDGAKHASLNVLAQLDDGGLKPTLMTNAQDTIVLDTRGNGFLRIKVGEAQRLFTKHMFAGLRCRHNLIGMLLMGRAQNDRLHVLNLQK